VTGTRQPVSRRPESCSVGCAPAALNQAVDSNQEAVFRVELAGHGFTLVVRRADDTTSNVDLIETIANLALITPSLHRQPLPPEKVFSALVGMVDNSTDVRRQSAKALDWDADDFWLGGKSGTDPVFPNIGFRWWSGSLRPDAVARWAALFRQRFDVFATLADQ
jgi:hypothetical protein